MSLQELMEQLSAFFPSASVGEDLTGQLLIYTDKRVVRNGDALILEDMPTEEV